ncbi:MAG: WYL domain-containing protein, partial [Dehalococcoidia bacterium]
GLDRERQAAEIKLLDALPQAARAEAQAAAEEVLVDLGADPDRRVMGGLRRAIRDRRILHIRRHEERGQRPYAPLGLAWSAGAWCLVARDVQAGRLVALPLDTLALVRRGAETFTRPPGFDLASAWRAARPR